MSEALKEKETLVAQQSQGGRGRQDRGEREGRAREVGGRGWVGGGKGGERRQIREGEQGREDTAGCAR